MSVLTHFHKPTGRACSILSRGTSRAMCNFGEATSPFTWVPLSELVPITAWVDANPAPSARDVINNPATSFWLREALQVALIRDPVDALADAELMASVLRARLTKIQGGA